MSKILFENSNIEFIDGDRGKNYPKQEDFSDKGHCMFLSAKNVTSCGFNFDNKVFISSEKDNQLKAGKLKRNDIVITTRGTIGNVAIYDDKVPYNDVRINSGMLILRADSSKLDTKFLYYYLSSKEFKEQVNSLISGSAVPQLPIRDIKKLTLPNITKKQQEKIANIISSFEDRIELNTQINQTLEQIAQALFKSWFVDFDPVRAKVQALSDGLSLEQAELAAMQAISGKTPEELTALSQTQPDRYAKLAETAKAFPCEMVEVDGVEMPKGWKKTTLSEICEMQNGYAFKSSEWTDSGIPVIKIGSIQSKILTVEGNGFVSEDNLSLRSNFVLNDGDIVIGLTGAYVGKVGRIPANKRAMLNQRVAKFLAKRINESETFYSFIYMNVIQEEFKNFVDFTAQGSAQPNISTKDILKYPLLLANNEVHLAFEKLLKKILDKSIFNSYQNEILSNSRDLLLPKLLNEES